MRMRNILPMHYLTLFVPCEGIANKIGEFVFCKGSRQNREDMTRIDRLDRYDCDDQEELRAIYYVRVTCTVTYFDFQTEYGLLLAETDGAFLH